MPKPKVDITETGGAKWSMAKLVEEALRKQDDGTANEFLGDFNRIAVDGSDDEVIACLSRWAILVFEGLEIGATIEEAESEVVESEETAALMVPDDTKQLGTDAAEYLEEVSTVDIDDVGYTNTVVFLADVKSLLSAINDKRLDLTKGARETIDKINAEFKPALDRYKKAEKILKEKIIEFRADTHSVRQRMLKVGEVPPEPVPEVEGLIIKEKWDIRVDKNDLPLDYLIPDMKAIEAAVKEGKTIPGVIADRVETLAVEHKKVKR